ncbi:MAG: hypothetical protein AAB947_00570 [Patescibacteria group bacterium]
MITMVPATLPWSGKSALEATCFRDEIAHHCGGNACFLPANMRFLTSPNVTKHHVELLIERIGLFLADEELPKWLLRRNQVVRFGFSTDTEMKRLLDPTRNPQSWIIYNLSQGGLPDIPNSPNDPIVQYGVIPCSAVRHHAVAWWREVGSIRTALLSGRAPGMPFDLDSDVGHEAVHAAFSPVPFFSQTMEERSRAVPFCEAVIGALTYEQRARIAYTLCEIGLATLRGEPRPTPAGLINIEEWGDARAFLRIAHDLMPELGFDKALEMIRDRSMPIGTDEPAFFAIGVATLRAMWHLVPRVNECIPPDERWYRGLCA